jgi:hypothetical protein
LHKSFQLSKAIYANSLWTAMSSKRSQRLQQQGQAIAEITIALITLVILIIGIATLSDLCIQHEFLQRDTRFNAGVSALARGTYGDGTPPTTAEVRSSHFHRINSYTQLENYSPALPSRLPMSQYTLSNHTFEDSDLGLEETKTRKPILLDEGFIRFIYGKGVITLESKSTFPALSGLTP